MPYPSLRHEKRRSFLFSRLDLLNSTDPDEVVRNVEYMLYVMNLPHDNADYSIYSMFSYQTARTDSGDENVHSA